MSLSLSTKALKTKNEKNHKFFTVSLLKAGILFVKINVKHRL